MSVDRSRLPELGPDPAFHFPRIARHRLANGLDVRTVEHPALPVVSLVLVTRDTREVECGVRPQFRQTGAVHAHETCTSSLPGSAWARWPFGTTVSVMARSSRQCART